MATNNGTTALAVAQQETLQTVPVIVEMAATYKMSPGAFIRTVKETIMPNQNASGAQILAFLTVARQYRLNPFTRQIFAFPSKGGGITPMIPVDGWADLIQKHEQFNGVEFDYHWTDGSTGAIPAKSDAKIGAITCKLHRKDMNLPIVVTEFLEECYRQTEPWQKWPRRMLRHKALIQCARIAFGFSGIYDEDEAERIAEVGGQVIPPAAAGTLIDAATGKPAVPNMSAKANADLRERLAEQKQASPTAGQSETRTTEQAAQAAEQARADAGRPANPSSAPTVDTQTQRTTGAPSAAAGRTDSSTTFHDPGPAPEVKQQPKAAGKAIPEGAAGYLEAPDPDPLVVDRSDKERVVRGTITKVFPPKKKGNGSQMGVVLGSGSKAMTLGCWHKSLHDILMAECKEGEVAQFVFTSKPGNDREFFDLQAIERLGPWEYGKDENGKPIRVIRYDRGEATEEAGDEPEHDESEQGELSGEGQENW